jgi:hypothetical protein
MKVVKVSTVRTGVSSFKYTLTYPNGKSDTYDFTVQTWAAYADTLNRQGWSIQYI